MQIPIWREPSTPVHIRLDDIQEGMFDHEWGIVLTINGEQHAGWAPKDSVSVELEMIQGAIIADLDDGAWLVGLPVEAEMLHSNRFVINGEEKERLIDCYLEEV